MPLRSPANVTPVTTAPSVHVVGAASIWVLGQVAGPRRDATVLHAGRNAVYLDVDGTCLAVLAARAVQVPCGVRTALPTLPELSSGDKAFVIDGSIEIPGCEVLVTDIVDTTVPVVSAEAAAWGAARITEHAGPRLEAARTALPTAALDRLASGDSRAVTALLGLGAGLTPLGDDVLCGWLASAVSRRHPSLDELRSVVAAAAARRTTTLSATLLGCAARGEGVPEFRTLLSAVASRNGLAVDESVDLILGVGASSGAGLLLGAVLALGDRP
jgi:hypothetical protein